MMRTINALKFTRHVKVWFFLQKYTKKLPIIFKAEMVFVIFRQNGKIGLKCSILSDLSGYFESTMDLLQ